MWTKQLTNKILLRVNKNRYERKECEVNSSGFGFKGEKCKQKQMNKKYSNLGLKPYILYILKPQNYCQEYLTEKEK